MAQEGGKAQAGDVGPLQPSPLMRAAAAIQARAAMITNRPLEFGKKGAQYGQTGRTTPMGEKVPEKAEDVTGKTEATERAEHAR